MRILGLQIGFVAVLALVTGAVAQPPTPQIDSLVLGDVENCHMAGGCRADVLLTYSFLADGSGAQTFGRLA